MNIDNDYVNHLKSYYTTIISQIISDDGRFLLAATKNGQLAVFCIDKYLKEFDHQLELISENNGSENSVIKNLFKRHPTPISVINMDDNMTSLCSVVKTAKQKQTTTFDSQYKFLIGGVGQIKSYRLSAQNLDECDEECIIKLKNDSIIINSIIMADENRIIVGCNDLNIYVFDYETQKLIQTFRAHKLKINCLKSSNSIIYSCGDDGKIFAWNFSNDQPIFSIEPNQYAQIQRKTYGKWIGSLDISNNNEWIVCGGAPKLSVWHLRSRKCSKIIDTPGVIYSTHFIDDNTKIMAAGTSNKIIIYPLNNDDTNNLSIIDSSIETIYSINNHYYDRYDYDLYAISGNNNQIEICKNAKFIDWKFYMN